MLRKANIALVGDISLFLPFKIIFVVENEHLTTEWTFALTSTNIYVPPLFLDVRGGELLKNVQIADVTF